MGDIEPLCRFEDKGFVESTSGAGKELRGFLQARGRRTGTTRLAVSQRETVQHAPQGQRHGQRLTYRRGSRWHSVLSGALTAFSRVWRS